MRTVLTNAYAAEIVDEGARLNLFAPNGEFAFSVAAPSFSTFVAFSEHAIAGICPLISFDVGHTQNGWMDWYCKIDMEAKLIRLLNPFK